MPNMARLRVDVGGAGVVGASVMTFYGTTSGSGLPAAVVTYLNALKANFPNDVTFTVPGGGDLVDDATGNLTGSWSDGGGGAVTGTDNGAFQLGSGFRIKWGTGGIVAGRRVRGTTFMVPAASLCFDTTGRLGSATVSAIQTATNAFLSTVSPNLVIWSRPVPGRAGSSHAVTSGTVPTSPTQLRSRRV
jgi:hypothetical protein